MSVYFPDVCSLNTYDAYDTYDTYDDVFVNFAAPLSHAAMSAAVVSWLFPGDNIPNVSTKFEAPAITM